ncbi:unnamed protein product (mitochondrion) [Plasmodiophora brassicae]|uniref:Uncharacterized protein n=1 Tax=Plasmodiophora brassicae TaxID=37360 RepID=A0A3P3YH75_PLABS|nr:unnamed protein product [Plasmodiophora brassicae]
MAVAVDGGPQRQRRGPLILVVIVLLASAITTAARYLLLPILPLRAAGAFQRFAPQPLTSRDALRHCVPGFLLGLFCVAVACLPAVIIAVVVQMALNLSHVTMLYILSGALPVLTVLYAIAVQFESATECLSLPSVVLHSLAAAFLDPVLFVLGIVVVAFRRDRLLAQGSQSMNQWRLSVVAQFGWCMADLCVLPAVLFCALLPWRFGHLLAQRKAHLADGRDLDALVVPLVQVLRLLNDLPYLAVGMVAVVTVYRALPFINGLWDSYSARDYKWTSFRSTCLTHAWYVICDVPVFLCAGICLVFVWRVVLLVRERDGDMRKRVVHHALLALCDLPVFCIALPVVLLTVYRVRNLKAGPKSGDLHLCIVAEFVAFLIDAPFMILSSVLIVLPYRIPLLFAEIRRSTTNWKARQAVLVEIRETLLDLLCLIPALLCLAFAWRLPALLQNLLKPIPASRRRTLVGVGSVLGICDIATVIPGLILLVTVYRTRYAWKRINDRRREPGGPFSPHAVIWRNGLIATVEFPVAVAGLGLLLALAVWRVPSLASIWSNSAVPANKKRVALELPRLKLMSKRRQQCPLRKFNHRAAMEAIFNRQWKLALVIVGSEVWELLLDLTVIPLALIVVLEVIRAQRLFDLFVSNLDIPNGTRRYRVVALFADTVLDVVLVATLPLALLFPWRLHKLVRRAPYAENLSGVGFRTRFFMHIRDGTFDVPFAILFILLLPTWRCPIVVKRIWGQRNRTDLQDVRRVSDSNRNAVQSSPVDVRRCIGSEFVSLVLDIVALTSIAIVVVLPVVLVVLFHAATAVTAVIFLLCGCRLLLVCRDVRFCNWDAVRVRSVLYTSALLGVLDAPCFVMALLGRPGAKSTGKGQRNVMIRVAVGLSRVYLLMNHLRRHRQLRRPATCVLKARQQSNLTVMNHMRRHRQLCRPVTCVLKARQQSDLTMGNRVMPVKSRQTANLMMLFMRLQPLSSRVLHPLVIDIPFLLLFILLIVTGWRSSEAMRQYSTKKGNLPRAAFALQFCNLVIDLPVISAALILTLWAHRTRGMWKAVANAPSASDRRPIIGKHMIVACADVLALPFLAVNIVTLYRLEGLRLRILGLLHSDGSLHDELRPHWNFLVSSGQIVADIPHLIMAVIVTFTWRSRSLWNELLAIRRARRCFEPAQGTERPPPGYREPAPSAPNVDVVESVAVEIPSDAQRDVAPPPDHLALDVSASHDVNHSVEPPPYESPAQQDDTKQLALRSYREPIQQEFAGTCVDIPFVIAGALAAILLHRSVCLILDLGRCSSAKERRKAAVLNLALFFVDAVAAVLFIVPILATGFRLPRTCRDIANVAMFPPALSLEERVRPHAVILRECWAAVVGTSTAVVFIAIALPAMALCLWRLPTLVAFIRAGRPLISSAFMMWMFYVLDVVALLEMAVISSLVVRCHCFWSACHTIVRQFREWQSCESVEARTAFVEQLDERQRFQNALNDYFGTHEGNVQSGASLTLVWDIVSEEFSRSLLSIPFIIMLPFNILGYVLLPPYYLAKYRVNGPKHWQSYLVRPLRYVITHCPEPRSIAKMDRFFAYNFIVTLPCVIFDMIAVAAAVPHVAVIHASCWTFAKVKVPLERDAAEANAVAAAEQHPFTANTLFQAVIFPVLAVLECSFVGLPVATFFLTRAYRFCAVATAVHASVWAVIAPATIQLANQYRVALQRQAVFAPWRLWVAIGRASFLCVPCRLVLDTVVLGPLRAVTRVCWRISQQGGLIGELVGEILFMGFLVAWVAWPLLLFLANTIAGICGVFLTLALVVTSVRPVKESWGPPVDGH